MRQKIYTVRACRWGDRGTHSYIVGVYSKKHKAQKAAETEEEHRGGKYECEILEWIGLNEGIEGRHEPWPKEAKPLPKINILETRGSTKS